MECLTDFLFVSINCVATLLTTEPLLTVKGCIWLFLGNPSMSLGFICAISALCIDGLSTNRQCHTGLHAAALSYDSLVTSDEVFFCFVQDEKICKC